MVETRGRKKGTAKTGGRKKGSVNKQTALIKDAIIEAAEKAGGPAGMVGYLQRQADENPTAFMGLLGKVIPVQVSGSDDPDAKPIEIVTRRIVRTDD